MRILKITFTIIGAVIGAGFASGKEIFEYFAKYGISSVLFVIPLFFILFFFIKMYLKLGSKINNFNLCHCNDYLCKKVNMFGIKFNYLNCFMFFTFLILSSAMFSGLISLFKTYIPTISEYFVFVLVFVVSLSMIKVSFKFLTNLSYIVVPLIIICIVINSVFSLSTTSIMINFGITTILPLPFLTILYASQNVFLASFVIIKSGNSLNNKQQNIISLLVAGILCLLIIFGILCFMANPKIANSDMPFAELAIAISPYFSLLFGIIIFFSIITTYSTTITSLKEYFNGKKKYNKPFFMICLIALLSLLNFGTIVEFLYPIIGLFGVVYCFKIYNYETNLLYLLPK